VKYVSTRGNAPAIGFCDVLLTGLARDGGLYVPEEWPVLDAAAVRSFAGKPYAEIAKTVLAPFVEGEIPQAAFEKMVDDAYATFHHKAVVPLVQIGPNSWILELFHGPTLAFKDFGARFMARIMGDLLKDDDREINILVATSGDTGSAVAQGFLGVDGIKVKIGRAHV